MPIETSTVITIGEEIKKVAEQDPLEVGKITQEQLVNFATSMVTQQAFAVTVQNNSPSAFLTS